MLGETGTVRLRLGSILSWARVKRRVHEGVEADIGVAVRPPFSNCMYTSEYCIFRSKSYNMGSIPD